MLIKAFPTEKQARQYIKNQYTRKSLIGNLAIMEVPKSRPPGNQMKGDMEVVKESVELNERKYVKLLDLLRKRTKEIEQIDKAEEKSGVKNASWKAVVLINQEIKKEVTKLEKAGHPVHSLKIESVELDEDRWKTEMNTLLQKVECNGLPWNYEIGMDKHINELSKIHKKTFLDKRGGSKNEIGNLRTEYINNTLARPNLTEAERNYLLSSQRGVVQSQKDDSGDEAAARRDRSESPSRSPLFSPSIRTPIMQGGRADTMGASSRRPSQPSLEFSSRPSPTSINVSASLVGGAASSVNRRRESTGGGDPRLPPLLGMPSISAFVDSDDSGGGNEIVYRSDAADAEGFREDTNIMESDFSDFYR